MSKNLITTVISIFIYLLSLVIPIGQLQLKLIGLFAFSGAVTNWIAIHMLFEKVPGFYGSGVITLKFEAFKSAIKQMMMNQFFTKEQIQKFIKQNSTPEIDFDPIFIRIKEVVMESQFGSMLSMFGGEKALDPMRPKFEEKFKLIMDDLMTNSANQSEFSMQIEKIVDSRLNELTPIMVKNLIQEMIEEHLGWLVIWGGVFGGLIGLLTSFL